MRSIHVKKYRNFLCLMGVWSMLLTSCVTEDIVDDTHGGTEGTTVRVSLQMPSAAAPGTYAISSPDENEVSTIDVLAFKKVGTDGQHPSGWAYAYKTQGTAITNTGTDSSKKQFNVTLTKSTDEQAFVILANVRNEVEGLGDIAVGADKDALLERLVCENTGSWNANNDNSKPASDPSRFRPFPMWGEKKGVLLTDGTTEITGISMLRGIARVDVVLATQVVTDNNFKLKKVYVYNSKNRGYIVPNPTNMASGRATAATIPSAADYASWNNTNPLEYMVPAALEKAFEQTIYLFEAKAAAQDGDPKATCLVVGGTYGTDSQISYYRVDFVDNTNNTYRDILRNHKYRFVISKVSGSGYPTPEDAFNSKAINMQVQVTEWNDGDFESVTFDGQYYLSVSPTSGFSFSHMADPQKASVRTDVPAGWKITKITEANGTTPNSGWLTTDKTTGSSYGADGANVPVYISVTKNTTSAKRTGHIYVQAGRLEARITVTQDITSPASLEVTSGGQPITVLNFASNDLEPKTIDISWSPQDADLGIINSAVYGYPAFPTTSGIPTTGTVPEGNSGTGKISYTITAPTLTDQEKAANPFMEKKSKLSFSVGSGSEKVEKTILVRYINYALTTDLNTNGYLLDNSKTHSITIKSNSSWKVKSVTGDTDILSTPVEDIQSQQGGNNINGDALTFKLTSDNANSIYHGKKITITLTDLTGKVPDTVLEIKGIYCGVNGTAVLKRIGANNYLTHMYGDKCWMVQNSMEGTFSGAAYGLDASGNSLGSFSTDFKVRGVLNGCYYTFQQAAGACPAGWHLPTVNEAIALKAAVDTPDRNTNPVSKWWCGLDKPSTDIYTGNYNITGNRWGNWGESSEWWYGSDGLYLDGYVGGIIIREPSQRHWFSVRCVQDQ